MIDEQTNRQSMAGKIVKRGVASTLSSRHSHRGPNLGDQSSISRIHQTIPIIPEHNNNDNDELEIKKAYPVGEMLLREEEMQNSMMQDGYS